MIKVPIYFLYFIGAVNVCKQNVKTRGVKGTITGSFTADQLRTGDYECILQFNDVPPYSVFEFYINSYSYPYDCGAGTKRNYLRFKGFTSSLQTCLSSNAKEYTYRENNRSISIIPKIKGIAPLEFILTYRGKSEKQIVFSKRKFNSFYFISALCT